jgi:large subunit ribosomal protein L31
MKPDIHPPYHQITVKISNSKDSFITYSSIQEEELIVDVDFRKHPAWTKKGISQANANSAKVSKFNDKFGKLFNNSSPAE